MFEYQRKFVRPRLLVPLSCLPRLFRTLPDGSSSVSTDYSVENSDPLDFQLDNLISSRVPLDASPIVEDISLNALDNVEKSSLRLLESEQFIVKSKNE